MIRDGAGSSHELRMTFAAPNKMHYLDLVAFPKPGRYPFASAHQSPIHLDGEPFRLESEYLEKTCNMGSLCKASLFAVDRNVQLSSNKGFLRKGAVPRLPKPYDLRINCLSSPRPRFDCASITIAAVPAVNDGIERLKLATPSLADRPI
jgi:hypothetical protein